MIRDADASAELRQQALDALMHVDYARAHFLGSCVADDLSSEACDARSDALDLLMASSADDPALFDRLGAAITPGILYDVEEPWVDAMQAAAAQWLDRRAETADGYTEAWVFARLSVALAAGDLDGARALLDARGVLLTRPYFVGARMALLEVEAGEAFYGIEPLSLPPLPAPRRDTGARGLTGRLRLLLRQRADGRGGDRAL